MDATPADIVAHLQTEAHRPLKAKELAKALGVPTHAYGEFKDLLASLEEEGLLYRVKGQRYAVPKRINLVVGRVQVVSSGAAFIIPDEPGEDLFVPAQQLGSALDGDKVVVRVERRRRGRQPEGRVIKVLERARSTIVGPYHPARNFGFVVPEDRKIGRDVFVPPGQEAGAQDGDVVVVRITAWGDEHKGPAGEVERVLGRLGDPGVDVLAVVHGHELPLEFPSVVLDEAEAIRERGLRSADLEGRLDLRDTTVFTIDPADAKDHDDALSIRRDEQGLWEVGVHIADVSHYVQEASALDAEALRRGTSVYLVDRVIPMLPEALSSDLCSLKPAVDRLALSMLIRMDDDGEVRGRRLARTAIRSRHRLSYDDAQRVLDGAASLDPDSDAALAALLGLSRKLRAARQARGSIDFDLPEARVVLNTRGEPTDIQRVLRLETHRMIEDFMLLANRLVAEEAARRKLPFLYRVHEPPAADRLEQLRAFLKGLGLKLGGKGAVAPKDLQRLIERVEGRPEAGLVSTLVLRSMKQARYHEESLGHFGLAMRHYTHFTSPIRRYPDLIVHRLIASALLQGEPPSESLREEFLPTVARVSSRRERVAVEAERDSVDLKKAEFMQRHLGDEFDGTISGVTSFGLFVLLDDFFVEGLVHLSSLDDDYYRFLEDQFALVGEHRRRRFQLGDRARVQVARVDLEQRKLDFTLVDHTPARGNGAKRRG